MTDESASIHIALQRTAPPLPPVTAQIQGAFAIGFARAVIGNVRPLESGRAQAPDTNTRHDRDEGGCECKWSEIMSEQTSKPFMGFCHCGDDAGFTAMSMMLTEGPF
jgi:hypothetical protein